MGIIGRLLDLTSRGWTHQVKSGRNAILRTNAIRRDFGCLSTARIAHRSHELLARDLLALSAGQSLVWTCQDSRCGSRSMGDVELDGQNETFKDRLRRYVDNPASDTLGWMRVCLQNQPVVELKRALEFQRGLQ
jgi:hypothetical protein